MARNILNCRRFPLKRLTLMLAVGFAAGGVSALPTGGQVVSGTAGMAQSGQTLTVTNSNGAIINWQSFSIGSGETTVFVQPSATSSVLNRVVTADPSVILGQLQSNGQVFLINPAGILVGPGARIDVGGFVASSLQLSDADFLARRFNFQATPGAGPVRNEGTIRTPNGGSVYLVGPTVENVGLIAAPGGEVLLAAGQSVQLVDTATPGVHVEVTGSTGQATNMGSVLAEAGRIGMVGALVKNSGTLSASSAVAEGGRVFLRATRSVEQTAAGRSEADGIQGGTVTLEANETVLADGRISATGSAGTGGKVRLLADQVGLVGNAAVDASGATGGGTVLVGGDYQGSNPAVRNAKVTWFGTGARIKADATDKGDGGKVIVWADDATRAYGKISARGGAHGGNGGFAEVSGKNYLDFLASADLRSPLGRAGTLLLDPTDITILGGSALSVNGTFSGGIFDGGGDSASTIGWSNILTQLSLGNVVISTKSVGGTGSGTITINGSPGGLPPGSAVISHTGADGNVWSTDHSSYAYSSPNSLSFIANSNIFVNSSFANAGTGNIKMVAGWDGVSTSAPAVTPGTGSIIVNDAASSVVIANVGGGIDLTAGNSVVLKGGSAMGGTNKVAGIDLGSGALNVTANNIELLAGATAGYTDQGNSAFIQSNGNQTFNVLNGGHLWLKGGGNFSDSSDFRNDVRISAHGSGSQTFNISAGGSVQVLGGNGNGADYGGGYSGCPITGTPACANNQAEMAVEGSGNQTIAFAGGGSLVVTGGTSLSSRGNNSAKIGVETGNQTISGGAAITVTSGAGAGGFFFGGRNYSNEAGIFAGSGIQNVSGSALTLDASATSGVGGAFLVGGNQNINISGNISLTGGSSSVASKYGLSSGAVIGNDAPSSINITAGGAFNMNAGSGPYGGVFVGTVSGDTDVSISAQGIALGGSAAAPAVIGALDGSPASIVLTATGSGGTSLGANSRLLAGSGDVTINHNVAGGASVSQASNSKIVADRLTVNGKAGILLTGLNNLVNNVALETVNGNIEYTSNAPLVHVSKAKVTGSGNVILNNGPSGYAIALNQVVVSTANTVNVAAKGYILDDNGDGVANITAGSVILSTVSGGNPGGIAISADVVASNVSATVPAASGDGGIRIHSLGAAPLTLNLNDATTTGLGDIFFTQDGNLTTTANYVLSSASGSVITHASGDLSFNGGSLSGPQGVVLAADGNLSIPGSFTPNSDMGLFAGNSITINGTASNLGAGAAIVKAPTVTIGSGGVLESNAIDLGATVLNVDGLVEGRQWTDIIAGQININGGTIKSSQGDVTIDVESDIRMKGGLISAGNDVSIAFMGSASTLYLNESAGLPAAKVVSATFVPTGVIELDFPGRADGGVVIDGLSSFLTTSGSGFYNGTIAAVLEVGLFVNYGMTELISQAVNPDLTKPIDPLPAPPSSSTSVIAATTSGTDGGTTGTEEFGGGAATSSAGDSGTGNEPKTGSKDDGKNGQGKNKRRGICT